MKDIIKNSDRMTEEKIKMLMDAQAKNEDFMKENIRNVYSLLKDRDAKMEDKDQFILEQKTKIVDLENKMAKQSEFIENQIKQYSLDKTYLDTYMETLKKESESQKLKNIILIGSIVLLFGVTLTLLIMIMTKSPAIYSV